MMFKKILLLGIFCPATLFTSQELPKIIGKKHKRTGSSETTEQAAPQRIKLTPPEQVATTESSAKEAKEEKAQRETEITQEELAAYEKELLAKYKPNEFTCGPSISTRGDQRSGAGDLQEKGGENLETIISCLIAGKKHVYYGTSSTLKQLATNKRLQKLVESKKIQFLPSTNEPDRVIVSTQQGYPYAQLFEMSFEQEFNDYLRGHLLGYSDEDIFEFYKNSFKDARKKTLDWIEEETPTLESPSSQVRLKFLGSNPSTMHIPPKLAEYEKAFLAKYHPTPERCRPQVRAGGSKSFIKVSDDETLFDTNDPEQALACLISGNSNVVHIAFTSWHSRELPLLLAAKQIAWIPDPSESKRPIFFNQRGRDNAVLLQRYLNLDSNDKYDIGEDYPRLHLLGVSDDDIQAYYLYKFQEDRDKALKWIKETLPTIPPMPKSS